MGAFCPTLICEEHGKGGTQNRCCQHGGGVTPPGNTCSSVEGVDELTGLQAHKRQHRTSPNSPWRETRCYLGSKYCRIRPLLSEAWAAKGSSLTSITFSAKLSGSRGSGCLGRSSSLPSKEKELSIDASNASSLAASVESTQLLKGLPLLPVLQGAMEGRCLGGGSDRCRPLGKGARGDLTG